ncbi:MAG: ATP-binding protein [Candidatus Eisenbacteria bacterium]
MTEQFRPNQILLRIPGRLDWLDLVDRTAGGIAAQLAFSQEDADGISNSVLEAGTNAIQHGHRYNPDLPVDILFEITDAALQVRVHDEGPGFDAQKVLRADPTDPDFLLAPRGRGIFIMRSLMDEVIFDIREGKGCTAILTKYRKPA